MKPHAHPRPLAFDYAVILGAWLLMFAYLTSGKLYTPPGPQTYSHPIVTRNPVWP
jgi:hypothetical protein